MHLIKTTQCACFAVFPNQEVCVCVWYLPVITQKINKYIKKLRNSDNIKTLMSGDVKIKHKKLIKLK